MIKRRPFLQLCAIACGVALLGLPNAYAADNSSLPVVASFSVLGDMVQQIGGADVKVSTLVGPDGDSHGYQPTSKDLQAVTHAQLVFVNGLGLDSWMDKLLESAGSRNPVITATAGIAARTMTETEGDKPETVTDPHAWQDLRNGLVYADNIAAALIKALPDHAADIKARAAAYKVQIQALDKAVRDQINAVPEAQRVVITSHDAFGYFGAAYGVRFEAPYGLSTETEPSAAAIGKLVDQIKQAGVKTVFIENMTNPKLIEQLGKDGGATLGGTLYSDALSPADGPAPHYLAMFKNNVPKLVAAMQQNAVAKP